MHEVGGWRRIAGRHVRRLAGGKQATCNRCDTRQGEPCMSTVHCSPLTSDASALRLLVGSVPSSSGTRLVSPPCAPHSMEMH